MKIIYGVVAPDSGEMRWNGRVAAIASPKDARALGISMVFQHFSLFETLTVAENVWLGLGSELSLADVRARLLAVASQYRLTIEPDRPIYTLSTGERQWIEIVRALLTEPELLILDEPTSVLTPPAVEQLFSTLRALRDEGRSVLYISHKLHEIRGLCDRCTVLRAGSVVAEVEPSRESNASLARMMIGAAPTEPVRSATRAGDTLLSVRDLCLEPDSRFGVSLKGISLELRAGRILGVAGVSGNGQAELFAALSGEDPRLPAGCVLLRGEDMARRSPGQRRTLGLRAVPEQRLGRGAVPELSLAENALLTRTDPLGRLGFVEPGRLRRLAETLIDRFRVKARGVDAKAASLSGGNLQKYLLARETDGEPRVLLLAQPTWGVDVGAQAEIHQRLLELRSAGVALLVVSEDLDELFTLSDEIAVIAGGRVSPAVPASEMSVQRVGIWMSGLWGQDAEA
jgi:simple sugar transport system ATP-binding protein